MEKWNTTGDFSNSKYKTWIHYSRSPPCPPPPNPNTPDIERLSCHNKRMRTLLKIKTLNLQIFSGVDIGIG